MHRRGTDEDVYVWVARLKGTQTGVAVRANRDLAQSWITDRLGEDGTWNESGAVDRYDAGIDTGIIELKPVPDVDGLLIVDG